MTTDRRVRIRALAGAGAVALLVAAGCDLGARALVLPVAPEGQQAVDVVAGDVDGDGTLDLVATTTSGYGVAVADGDGGFAVTTTVTPGSAGGSAALGDVDGDGDADLVHGTGATSDPGHVAVRAGDGAGGFAASPVVLPATRAIATAPVLGDVDGDGDLDVIAGAASGVLDYDMQAVIWDNQGDGTFGPATPVTALTVPFTDLLAGDVDGDGRLDLVVGMYYEAFRRVAVLRGTASGFAPPEYHEIGVDELDSGLRLAVADVDADGDLDVAGTNGQSLGGGDPTLFTLLNDGAGGFGPAVTSSAPAGEGLSRVTSVAVADVDGDGHADLATDEAVLFGAGDGSFGGPEPGDAREVAGGREVVAADVGGDARPDVAYVSRAALVVLINALD